MKIIKTVLVIVLLGSVGANFLFYKKIESQRVQIQIGARKITVKNWYDWLKTRYGFEGLAEMTKYEIVMQAAHKYGVQPDTQEIEATLQEMKDQMPAKAAEFKRMSWKEDDARSQIEYSLAMANLMTREVKAGDAEVKAYFDSHPSQWDIPTRRVLKILNCDQQKMAERAAELMKNVADTPFIQQQLDPKGVHVRLEGADGTWVVTNGNPLFDIASKMKVGDVEVVPDGKRFLVVKLSKVVPGKHIPFEEARKRVERDYKLTKSPSEKGTLRKLWNEAENSITLEDPSMKRHIKDYIFRTE